MGDQRLNTQVLIVGAGPVGLALAIELGWRNTPCLVVEAGNGEVLFPAGEFIFARTMEHMRRWGIAEAVSSLGWPHAGYRSGAIFATTVAGFELARFVSSPESRYQADPDYPSPQRPIIQTRFKVDPYLRQCAASYASVSLRYGLEIQRLEAAEGGGVLAIGRDASTGDQVTVRAAFAVGCDGAKSTVRDLLGVELVGEFEQGHNFAIFFKSVGLRALLDQVGMSDVCQIQTVAPPERPYITVVDGESLWRCSVYTEDSAKDPDPTEIIRAAVGADIDIEVIRAQRWAGHQVVASSYRMGPFFLAGDAAHLRWPKGGFGANTGIGDAVDIGWKLAALHDGWGAAGLLDSYEDERRPIAQRNNRWATENWLRDKDVPNGWHLEEAGLRGSTARADAAKRITTLRQKEYFTLGVQLGYSYDQSKICLYDDLAPAPEDRSDVYTPSSTPGARAPHVWLSPNRSTLDYFGAGFTLVRSDHRISLADLEESAERLAIPLSVLDIDPATTAGRRVAELYQLPLVLVRPDGHVAWRGTSVPPAAEELLTVVTGGVASALP